MNYNDQILEAKTFNFFKQLMYNIALSLCVILLGALISVYGFKFQLNRVLSPSEYPYLKTGDMVVIKAQKEYEVGDIIKFDNGIPTTHRLIGILKEGNTTVYLCHGDNVTSAQINATEVVPWEEDAAYVKGLQKEGKTINEIINHCKDVQSVKLSEIEGKVVAKLSNYGTYLQFIQDHAGLLIALVGGIWCISTTVQNEIDMRRARRLM